MSRWVHGKTVVNGEIQFLSVSSMQKGDSSTSTGCLRAWWYQYLAGIKEPPSAAMDRGIRLHAEIEEFLKTGSRHQLSSLALSGMHMVPEPGPDLLVEHSLIPNGPDGVEDLRLAPLRVRGIPVLGKIDVVHARGINKGGEDIGSTHDPEGTVETIDWKTTSNIANAKGAQELPRQLQMAGYGLYVFATAPDAKRVRLSHCYFPSKGSARKVTTLVTPEQLEPAWNHAGAVVNSLVDAAREKNVDLVDANTRACHAYGRDCAAKNVCRAATHNSLSSIMGVTAADRFLAPTTNAPDRVHLPVMQFTPPPFNPALVSPNQDPMTTDVNPMTVPFSPNSLMAKLQGLTAGQAPIAVAPPVPLPIAPPAAAPALSPEVVAAMAVLQAQETSAASNAPPALTFAPPPPPAPPAGPVAATAAQIALLTQINAYGVGMPSFSGDAAAAIALAQNPPIPVTPDLVFPGSGEIATHTINTLDVLPQVLESVQFIAKKKATDAAAAQPAAPVAPTPNAIPSILPPDAAPNPAIPNPGLRAELPSAPAPVASQAAPVAPPEPAPLPAPAATIAPPPPLVTPAAPGEKPKRIRRTKAQIAADEAAAASAGTAPDPIVTLAREMIANRDAIAASMIASTPPAPAPVVVPTPAPVVAPAPVAPPAPTPTTAPTTGAINLYVDCFVDGAHTQSLWPLADKVAAYMNDEARKEAGAPEGVPFDFRAADPNGKFGFGRWRGIYSACVHATPIGAGNWTIETRSEIGLAMVEAMRDIVRRSGGVLVIGAAR